MKNSKIIWTFLLLLGYNTLNAEILTFSKAYELALKNSNDLHSSEFISLSEKKKVNLETAQLYPQVNLSAYYRKSEYVTNPTKFTTKQTLLNYTLTVQQTLYNKEIYARIDAQKSRSKYSQTKVALDKEFLAQDLFKAYLDLLQSTNKIQLYKIYLEYNKSKLLELEKKYEMHLANKMDLLQMKVEYSSAKIDFTKEKKLFATYTLALQRYIGENKYELPSITPNSTTNTILNTMRSKIKSVKDSLKVKQAQIALEITAAEVKSARSGHYPNVSMNASYATYDTGDPTIDAPYDNIKYFMVNVNIPIYSGGYVSAKVDVAKLTNAAAREDLQSVKKQVQIEYEESMARFDAAAESISVYNEAYESALLYKESVDQALEHGLKSIIDVNDAKSKLYEVKYKYIENIYEMVNSYIALLIVTNNFEGIQTLDNLVK